MAAKPKPAPAKAWAADKVERRDIATLVPYANNSRTHSDEQIAQIAKSIEEWGWTVPVLIDEIGGLIAGHGRVLAAQTLGIESVPVMVATGWTDAQKRAYVIADNKLALNAGWDDEVLAAELAALVDDGFDVTLSGFSFEEMADLAADAEMPEDVVDLPSAVSTDSKVQRLTFGKRVVPLTDQEMLDLQASLDAYVQEFGIMNGWIGKLLGV